MEASILIDYLSISLVILPRKYIVPIFLKYTWVMTPYPGVQKATVTSPQGLPITFLLN